MADFHGLQVGWTLVDLGQPTVPVPLMNLTDQERRVQKGAEIAMCDAVQSVRRAADDASEAPARVVELLEHLKELYGNDTCGLNLEERQQVLGLLCEFCDVFSTGPHNLGRTDLVKHRIDTRGAAPFRQPP